jgi:hypothetical protein
MIFPQISQNVDIYLPDPINNLLKLKIFYTFKIPVVSPFKQAKKVPKRPKNLPTYISVLTSLCSTQYLNLSPTKNHIQKRVQKRQNVATTGTHLWRTPTNKNLPAVANFRRTGETALRRPAHL